MNFTGYGFGLYGWDDGDLCLVGGVRDNGYHPAGKTRSKFLVYDSKEKDENGRPSVIGHVTLLVKNDDEPVIENLINLTIEKKRRKQGYGRRVVEMISEIARGDVLICDIKNSAKTFWKKVGVENLHYDGIVLMANLPKKEPNSGMSP